MGTIGLSIPGLTILYADQEMNNHLEKHPLKLELANIGAITAETKLIYLKILKFNGTVPTIENVTNGRHPLVKNLYWFFGEDILSLYAEEIMNFVKSNTGEKILTVNSNLAMGEENKK